MAAVEHGVAVPTTHLTAAYGELIGREAKDSQTIRTTGSEHDSRAESNE